MELKATSFGKRLAQHPYDRVTLLTAGVKVSGDKHEYLLPFNQLIDINCKRGLVWGELEFVLPDDKAVRLHGTEWTQTQRFYHHLLGLWNSWSEEMSLVASEALNAELAVIDSLTREDVWLKRHDMQAIEQRIKALVAALPLPQVRLTHFENCRQAWEKCQVWLKEPEAYRLAHNKRYTDIMLTQHDAFFAGVENAPLDNAQVRAVVNGEDTLLVLAGAGSGKTSVLVARAGWLLHRGTATADQILLLAFGRKAAQEMSERISARLHNDEITVRTFHALALYIISQAGRTVPELTALEEDTQARYALLTQEWQAQCRDKKAQLKGWRQWLGEEMEWDLPEGEFWQDKSVTRRLAPRLDRWLGLIRMHGGTQAQMVDDAPAEVRELFSKRLKLLAPLLKAWKTALKAEGAVDFSGLIHQAINVLEKGRFISPWKHILVDEFQDLSPQRAALLEALRQQNIHTSLFAVGDDWQAIYRFSGAQMALTTAFHHYFCGGEQVALETTYRFNSRIGEVANRFIQQNPRQLARPLNSLMTGNKNAVVLLPSDQLEALLDKISSYAKPQERILLLARHHYLRPAILEKAGTRWPKLNIDFMTIHASKGQQAEYCIILGLQAGKEGFPAQARESVIEQALLAEPEDFPDAEERRLLYVALTRARHRVWLLYDRGQPSSFVDILASLDVPVARKP